MPRPAPIVVALCAAALALASCGGGDAVRTERPVLRLALDEYRIVPQDVSVRPGRMKFVARNTGRLTHNLVVQIPADKPGGEPTEIGRVSTMQPGQTAEPIKLTLLPGTYRLVCTIANHDDLGQFGELKVQE
jgi:hypothetical protein